MVLRVVLHVGWKITCILLLVCDSWLYMLYRITDKRGKKEEKQQRLIYIQVLASEMLCSRL